MVKKEILTFTMYKNRIVILVERLEKETNSLRRMAIADEIKAMTDWFHKTYTSY